METQKQRPPERDRHGPKEKQEGDRVIKSRCREKLRCQAGSGMRTVHSLNFLPAFLGFSVILSSRAVLLACGQESARGSGHRLASSPPLPLSHPLTRFLCVFLNQRTSHSSTLPILSAGGGGGLGGGELGPPRVQAPVGLLLVLSRQGGGVGVRRADHKPMGLEGLGNKPLALGTEPTGLGTAGDLPTAVRGSGLWAGRVQGVRPVQRAV